MEIWLFTRTVVDEWNTVGASTETDGTEQVGLVEMVLGIAVRSGWWLTGVPDVDEVHLGEVNVFVVLVDADQRQDVVGSIVGASLANGNVRKWS